MVKSKEELLSSIKAIIGDRTDDDAIAVVEDIADTVDDLTEKAKTDWEEKYRKLDADWREKYRNRFFDGETTKEEIKVEQKKDIIDDGEPTSFDDLLKESEEK